MSAVAIVTQLVKDVIMQLSLSFNDMDQWFEWHDDSWIEMGFNGGCHGMTMFLNDGHNDTNKL